MSPRVVTEGGSLIPCKDLQFANALFWIDVTDGGIVTFTIEMHPHKKPALIVFNVLGSVTFMSFLHPWKTFSPIVVIVSGMTTLSRYSHPLNALSSIVVTVDGNVMLFNEESSNAFGPITDIDGGISMVSNEQCARTLLPNLRFLWFNKSFIISSSLVSIAKCNGVS